MATHEPTTENRLRLGKRDHGRATSVEEFAEADFDEPWTYERVDGRLVVMSPEGTRHVVQTSPWLKRLFVYSFEHPEIVQAIVPQAWITISARNTRIADIGVYLGGKLDALDIPNQVPDLVFEFVSPSKKDRLRDDVQKRADYQSKGVREYVIVDPYNAIVTVLTLGNEGYRERVLTSAETYRSPLLPGFEVILSEVLPQ